MSFSRITMLLVVLTVVLTVLGCSDDNDTTDGGDTDTTAYGGDTDTADEVLCRTKADLACYAAHDSSETGCVDNPSCTLVQEVMCLSSDSCRFNISHRDACRAVPNCYVAPYKYEGCIPSCMEYREDEAGCVADDLCEFRAESTSCHQKGDPACWDAETQSACEAMDVCTWFLDRDTPYCSHKTDSCIRIDEEEECSSTDPCFWSHDREGWECLNACRHLSDTVAQCTADPKCDVWDGEMGF